MNPDGTNKRMIQRAQTFDLAWSPDGQWLAEVANIPIDLGGGVWTGYDELYVFKTDGSDLFADEAKVRYVKLSDDPTALVPIGPTFNQDGNRIAFDGVVPAENAGYVYVVNRDGSELRRLALKGGSSEFLPAAGGGGPLPTVDATHIVVPPTEGRTLASALKALTAKHFKVRVLKRYSKLRRGRVLGTKPRAGEKAHRPDQAGARLTMYVSKGRKPHRHHR
jgi:Tol biopolymer transport system component